MVLPKRKSSYPPPPAGQREGDAAVRARFPTVHTLAIGDLSVKQGGAITQHRSHQSGRDVDIGL